MTMNQISYQRLQEDKRSNLARESETERSNVARENENFRSTNLNVGLGRDRLSQEKYEFDYHKASNKAATIAKTAESSAKAFDHTTRGFKNIGGSVLGFLFG